jgi:hypothetical protein
LFGKYFASKVFEKNYSIRVFGVFEEIKGKFHIMVRFFFVKTICLWVHYANCVFDIENKLECREEFFWISSV